MQHNGGIFSLARSRRSNSLCEDRAKPRGSKGEGPPRRKETTEGTDREKRGARQWFLLNNSSIRRDYEPLQSGHRHRVVGFHRKSRLTFASSIPSAILLHGVEGEKKGRKGRCTQGMREANWTGKVFNLFMLPSSPHPKLFGSSSVSSDLIVLLSSSLYPPQPDSIFSLLVGMKLSTL